MSKSKDKNPANRDPITKEPGSHPAGTAAGATAGGAAGAAIGTAVGGPLGTVVGAVVGGVAGGLAGHAAGEAFNPTVEDGYWRDAYTREPYYRKQYSYDDYEPAYRTGYTGADRYRGRSFHEVEDMLRSDYERGKGKSRLAWDEAKHATKAAWHRVESAIPGDFDRDGR